MPKQTLVEGQTATNPQTGERIVYRGGKWYPYSGNAQAEPGPALTQDQGQAQGYAKLMANAEQSYQQARDAGYNPGSVRNTIASIAEGLPFGGLDGLGAAVRDDVGDKARQAELQWSDAQLKAMSGAAAPEQEVKRNVRTYFARPGENALAIAPQKEAARLTAFDAARTRAGPGGTNIQRPIVSSDAAKLPRPALDAYNLFAKSGRIDRNQPVGTAKHPYIARSQEVANRLPKGSWVIMPNGALGVVE